jgi:hypothetical protein
MEIRWYYINKGYKITVAERISANKIEVSGIVQASFSLNAI